MSEETPSPFPETRPEPPPSDPPPFWAMFLLGIGLLIVSGCLCAVVRSPSPFFLGAVVAVISVFYRGWRGIFAGYAATIGLVVLAVIIICGSGIVPAYHG